MYTQKELKIADNVSTQIYNWHMRTNNRVRELITQWGKNTINYNNLYTRVNATYNGELIIEIIISTEFGANFTLYFDNNKGIGFSSGSIGTYTVKDNPRQRDIMMLFGKLLEHHEKLEQDLRKVYEQIMKEKTKITHDYDMLKQENPGLLEEYYKSDIYKARKKKQEEEFQREINK